MKVVIYGTSRMADIVAYIIEKYTDNEIGGYIISDEFYSAENDYGGKNVAPFSKMVELYPPETHTCVMGFMATDLYITRENIYRKLKALGYSFMNVIHPKAVVETEDIGEGNIILAGCAVEPSCKIGNMNIFWQNVSLPHDNIIGDFNNLAPSVSLSGYSEIGNHCFIGNNSIINNCMKVNDYVFVGAGSFLRHPVPEYSVVVPQKSTILEGKKSTELGF